MLGLDRRTLSACLLGLAAIVFYLILPTTTPSGAQQGGGTVTAQDNNCPGAQVVDTTTGNGDKQTPTFNITGTSFRITISSNPTSSDPSLAIVTAEVMQPGGNLVTDFSKEGSGTDSSIINAGPGQFFLKLLVANTEYTVTTEDCTGTTQATGGQTQGGSPSQPGKARGGRSIINIPNKPLPPSAGLPVIATVAGAVLTGTALLALGILIRRGTRR